MVLLLRGCDLVFSLKSPVKNSSQLTSFGIWYIVASREKKRNDSAYFLDLGLIADDLVFCFIVVSLLAILLALFVDLDTSTSMPQRFVYFFVFLRECCDLRLANAIVRMSDGHRYEQMA